MVDQRVKNYDLIRSVDSLHALVSKLLTDDRTVGFDIETGYGGPQKVRKGALDMDWPEQFIAGFSISNDPRWARYVPVAHDLGGNLPEGKTWEIIQPVLETLPVVAHHAKFEERNLRLLDQKGRGPRIEMNTYSDTMLEAYALGEYRYHGLKYLVAYEFDHEMKEIGSLFPDATKKDLQTLRFNILDLTGPVVDYACEDALWALELHHRLQARALRRRDFVYKLEMGISRVLVEMEEAGCAVDWDVLAEGYETGPEFMERMAQAARKGLEKQSGQDLSTLNLNSAPQLKKLLYRDLGLKTTRLTAKGKDDPDMEDWQRMSTDENALAALAKKHPAIQKVLEVRQVKNVVDRHKKWSTEYRTGHDDRVHASFSQTTVAAGRFSASDPSIQQVPKQWRFSTVLGASTSDDEVWERIVREGTFGKHYWTGNFRDYIVAAPGFSLLTFDYSQVELRMLAGLSQEPALIEAFNKGVDVHKVTAAAMLGKNIDHLSGADRAVGKTMNFALLYGMGEQSLAERLAIPRDRADELYAEYFSAFSLITSWMERTRKHGIQNGYVTTHFGRRVPIWEFESESKGQFSKGERLCINAPVQGSAADVMKIAMLKVRKSLIAKNLWGTKVRLLNNLHDALTFEVSNDLDLHEVREVLKEAVVFEVAPRFPKLVADWELGLRWGSCDPWAEDQQIVFDDEADHWRPLPEFLKGAVEDKQEREAAEAAIEKVREEHEAAPIKSFRREPEPTRRYRVSIDYMPTRDQFKRFVSLLKEHPGRNVLVLSTPQGELEASGGTGIGLADQVHIQMVLASAEVTYEETVDA